MPVQEFAYYCFLLVQQGTQYRDRAKERRKKFGIPVPPEPKKKQQYKDATET
jgi:hypothetical protein